jgi:magnesium chelatase subunit I
MSPKIRTLGELKRSGYCSRSVREELRQNLLAALREGEQLFPGIIGYDETVVPQLVNALLSRHDILLLGLRGQAKTRILRSLVRFLDEWTPVVAGTHLNEDPLHPVTGPVRAAVAEKGDETPISWMHREQRFQEKLATPDVSMADLIGDIDPIRASRERLDLSDERVIHYGILPRTNRGLFLLNELPDLQARIQVGLLNILEERDVQIRGFPLRLDLDILMLFTANPEDYTNRGSIITPLKDRIGSQILTHYPRTLQDAVAITSQEALLERSIPIQIPLLFRELVEEIGIQARSSEYVDQTSGVSARLSISALELVASNVERRRVLSGDTASVPRLCDLFATLPAITGKCELVYEGEQEGSSIIASKLIGKAVKEVFLRHFPPIHRGKKDTSPVEPLYSAVQAWFSSGHSIEIDDARPAREEAKKLHQVDGLRDLARKYLPGLKGEEEVGAMELVLEGLHQHSVLSREGTVGAITYGDMLSRMMQDF